MRTLYFDCFAGASGNMILAALLGLGLDHDDLEAELSRLGLKGVSLNVTQVDRSGIAALHVEVTSPEQRDHRHLSDIVQIIERSSLDGGVKSQSIAIFRRLAEAEAKIHGISIDNVHFHEVGAVDAIIDIVGACIGFKMLGIEQFACSSINVGSGYIEMEHGKFPVPPPAVSELLVGFPIFSNEIAGELMTPTGAAIISTVCTSYRSLPEMKVEQMAYGAGTRSYERFPNVLRLMVGDSKTVRTIEMDDLVLIETNLDDVSPQVLGYVMERAIEIGALDCWFTGIQMKKNRPGTTISVLCTPEKRSDLSDLLYSETTTLGLRVRNIERECLSRDFRTVRTRFGDVEVKVAYLDGHIMNAMPEYEQVRRLAREHNVSFLTVQNEAIAELKRNSKASAA